MSGGATRKCVIWDLDGSIWDGVLLEDPEVRLRPEAAALIRLFDERGILQAVASRSDPDCALAALAGLGLREYFLSTQIHWGPKSESVRLISEDLGIPPDAMAFIDDQAFERDEVQSRWPGILCVDPSDLGALAHAPEFAPVHRTDEARGRRASYAADTQRREAESQFGGEPERFLQSLNLRLAIARARAADLPRIQELTVRTHQLNSTGRTFELGALEQLVHSPDHLVLVGSLEDRYGAYGRIALAVVERSARDWVVQLLLTSCRVVSRGVGTHFLACLVRAAAKAGVRLHAEFVPTPVNRGTLVMLRFAGFEPGAAPGVLEWRGSRLPAIPPWLQLSAPDLL